MFYFSDSWFKDDVKMVGNKTVDLKKKPRTSGSSMFFSLRISTVSCVSCFCAWKGWRDRKYFVFLNNRMQSHLLMLFFFYCGVFFRWFVFVTESSYVSSHVPILWSVRTGWASLDHFISGCHDNFQNQRFNTDGPCFRCTAN